MNSSIRALEETWKEISNERINLQIKEKTIMDALLILKEREKKNEKTS